MNKSFLQLELDVVLEKIKKYCFTETAIKEIDKFGFLITLPEINESLNYTQDLIHIVDRYPLGLEEDFDIFDEIDKLRISSNLNYLEVCNLKLLLRMEHNLVTNFVDNLKIKDLSIYNKFLEITNHKSLYSEINRILDNENLVYDNASPKLKELRNQSKEIEKKLKEEWSSILAKFKDSIIDGIVTVKDNKEVILIDVANINKIKGKVVQYSATKKNAYIEPNTIIGFRTKLDSIKQQEDEEITKILNEFSYKCFPFHPTLLSNLKIFVFLDVLYAKAFYSISIDGKKPVVKEDGEINLLAVRNPLIDKKVVVPIDIKLEKGKNILLITGSNTGGKTASLKTLGLIVLLNQFGILIPASPDSSIPIYHNVYSDIGDNQSIVSSLSTFSGHILQISFILKRMKSTDLVLLDELCSGTDPNEGSSLAISFLNYFIKKKVTVMVSTHYPLVKEFGLTNPNVGIASVAFDENSLLPLYKIIYDISGSSNAIKICQKLGISDNITKEALSLSKKSAQSYLELEEKYTEKIKKLDESRQEIDEERKRQSQSLAAIKEREAALQIEKGKYQLKLRNEFQKKYDEILEEFAKLQEEEKANKSSNSQAKVEKIKTDLASFHIVSGNIKVGDLVQVKETTMIGTVIKIKLDKFLVNLGNFKLEFDELQLIKLNKEKIQRDENAKIAYTKRPEIAVSQHFTLYLDLRGFRYDEIEPALREKIADATLARASFFNVIHGFGTGAVKKAVDNYLDNDHFILKYEVNPLNNGETKVWLK